ncbi:MAG: hypothetical protein FWE04_06765 [Oscillospiraceae bacterium]|nr:hypothetical protein [Oscillospiraceae bacterium]
MIDKTKINGFIIESIDFNKLEKMSDRVELNPNGFYYLSDGKSFKSLKITDNRLFKTLIAGYDGCITYAFIELSVSLWQGNNLNSLSINEYREQLIKVFEYLKTKYGVKCSELDNIKFKYLELNTTFQLEHDWRQYVRILQILMLLAPKPYNKGGVWVDRTADTIDTLNIKNQSIEVIIYNKTKQLKDIRNTDVVTDLMRVEYKFLKSKKIEDTFNTKKISELSDEMFKKFFIRQFTKDFINPYYKLKKSNLSKLKKLIRDYKTEYGVRWFGKIKDYFWGVETERIKPILLDTVDFFEAIKSILKNNRKYYQKKVLNDFPYGYLSQHEKAEEVFSKIQSVLN